jgi:hypothetical protein
MRHIKRYSQLFENSQELSQEQTDWLNKCSKGTWKLNPETGLVDVEGNFNCSGKKRMTNFKGVRFGHVSGTFDCCRSSLTSLEGAPQSVGGDFICHSNSLTSLEGAPHKVKGGFDCSHNMLTSLAGAPQSVSASLDCSNNQLTSLEGAPRKVTDSYFTLFCSHNRLTSLKGTPSKTRWLVCSNNQLTSLKGAPSNLDRFDCSNNQLTTLEGAPEFVRDFNCSHNLLTSFKGGPRRMYSAGNLNCSDNQISSLEGLPESLGFSPTGANHMSEFFTLEASNNPISGRTIKGLMVRMYKYSKARNLEQVLEDYWKAIPKVDRPYLAKHHPNLSPEEKRGYEALLKFRGKII